MKYSVFILLLNGRQNLCKYFLVYFLFKLQFLLKNSKDDETISNLKLDFRTLQNASGKHHCSLYINDGIFF